MEDALDLTGRDTFCIDRPCVRERVATDGIASLARNLSTDCQNGEPPCRYFFGQQELKGDRSLVRSGSHV
jgi:hypothetical protein